MPVTPINQCPEILWKDGTILSKDDNGEDI